MNEIPEVLLAEMVPYLGVRAYGVLASLCRAWRDAMQVPRLWQRLDVSADPYDFSDASMARFLEAAPPRAVRELVLRGCVGLGDAALASIAERCGADLRLLQLDGSLTFRMAHPTDAGVAQLAACTGLEVLWARRLLRVGDEGLRPVVAAAAGSLREIDLAGNLRLRGDVLAPLADCRRLERLSLAGCRLVANEALVGALQALPALRALSLRAMLSLDSTTLSTIVRAVGGGLRELDVSGCRLLDDAAAYSVAAHCGGLRDLRLAGLRALTLDGLRAVLEAAGAGLEALVISSCRELAPAAREAATLVAEHAGASLQRLEAADARMGDEELALLAARAPRLEVLAVNCRPHNKQLTDAGARTLAAAFPRLRELNIAGNVVGAAALAELLLKPGLNALDARASKAVGSCGGLTACADTLRRLKLSRESCPEQGGQPGLPGWVEVDIED